MDEWLKIIAAYALVFVVVFIFVGVLGFLLTKMIRAVGLSPVDRGLGAMFGVVRGLLIVVVVVFLLSFSGLRETDWWRNSVSAKPFETMAGILRYRLPDSVTKHFKMSAANVVPSPLRGEGAPLGAGEGDLSVLVKASLDAPPLSRLCATPSPSRGEGNNLGGHLCAA
jgi:hypothetical protein